MFSTKSFFCLTILVTIAAAALDKRCAIENNIEQSDWDRLNKDATNPVEKMLCFFKCKYTDSGVFKEDKTADAEKLIKHIENWKKLEETTKAEIRECVGKQTTTVNSCQDVKPYYLCGYAAVHKQMKSTA